MSQPSAINPIDFSLIQCLEIRYENGSHQLYGRVGYCHVSGKQGAGYRPMLRDPKSLIPMINQSDVSFSVGLSGLTGRLVVQNLEPLGIVWISPDQLHSSFPVIVPKLPSDARWWLPQEVLAQPRVYSLPLWQVVNLRIQQDRFGQYEIVRAKSEKHLEEEVISFTWKKETHTIAVHFIGGKVQVFEDIGMIQIHDPRQTVDKVVIQDKKGHSLVVLQSLAALNRA